MEYTPLNAPPGRIVMQRVGKPSYRLILFLHIAFKVTSCLLYLLSNLLLDKNAFASPFVLVLIVLSADFWLTKNLSGRLLAGLRWWSVPDENTGAMAWRFEAWTPEERAVAVGVQVNAFWTALVMHQAFWVLMLLTTIFTLKPGWFVLTLIACMLNGANLIGYVRCRLQQKSSESDGLRLFPRLRDAVTGLFKVNAYTRGEPATAIPGF